jgi:hypothetical protein
MNHVAPRTLTELVTMLLALYGPVRFPLERPLKML